MGVFEVPPFDKATNEVAVVVADLTKRGKILSVAGGGDTAAALANAGVVQLQLYFHGRRRIPRMAGRQGDAGR